ncbi:MAG TPA: YncE family protein [Candidatus Aquilonibacter sp.]|nr:YncE family protein [Candidatus Aquilonibacter sp.]
MKRLSGIALVCLLTVAGAVSSWSAAWAQGPYHVTDTWKIGGDGGWDYLAVDPQTKLLYVTRGNHVMAIDTSAGKVVADITGLKGTHGVVFDTAGKLGYITDGGANEVAVFDRTTHTIVKRVAAGTNPDGAVFEPVTQTVWAFNGRSKNATVIDASTQQVVATVPLPGKPEFPVADGKGSVFVNIEDTSQIAHIDAKTHSVQAVWPLAPCEGPSGQAIDKQHGRLFSVCDGKVMAVVDAQSGKVVATPAIGDGPDAAAFDEKDALAFSSNGEGTLTVIHQDSPDSYSVVQNVTTKRGARTMALDPDTGKVYVVTADFGPRPAPTPDNPRPRPSIVPGSFVVMVVSK